MNALNIIMYHYVRPIKDSIFPGIRGLELSGFRRQLDYLEENYSIVTAQEVINALKGSSSLPSNACWLTFDDGYKDHYQHVLPELKSRKLEGSFFPPSQAITDNIVLDVNAVHHILASGGEIKKLRASLDELCLQNGLKPTALEKLWDQYGHSNRFDDAETIYIKRLLQHALPEDLRSFLTKELFRKYVGVDLSHFSSELYMSKEEIISLVDNGMFVGSHGSRHYWLDRIDLASQEKDILDSLSFLEEIGCKMNDWIMCYPYGAYNQDTLKVLKKLGAAIGITTEVRQALLGVDNPLTLPRFDTNDFPQ